MIKKKIGIITFHRADNLGAVLQAFALQSVLERSCDVSAEIIDYKCPMIDGKNPAKKAKSIKALMKAPIMRGYYFIKHRGFERFRRKNLKLSSKTYDLDTVRSMPTDYDMVITGSDQVFNPGCSDHDYAYFLDFLDSSVKKISYAASIGTYSFSDAEQPVIRSLLDDFSAISVREESADKELERIGVNGALVHPDPVVLMSAEQWKGYMTKRLCREKYVLVYMVLPDISVTQSAEQYAKQYGYKVINNKKSIEFILHNSPAEFLSWIYHAECVFTNSFHGTAFSTIFNKPLAADIELRGGGINNRVNDFLKRVDASNCILVPNNVQLSSPDAQAELEDMRKSGIEYLKQQCI